MKIVVAVDPSTDPKKQGIAYFESGKLTEVERGNPQWPWGHGDKETLVIEDQYLARGHKANPLVMKRLIEARVVIECQARESGYGIVRVPPGEWQAGICRNSRRMKRPERIKTYRAYAANVAKAAGITRKLTNDECAAICIGQWYIDQKKRKGE